jgi:hypothetical protein
MATASKPLARCLIKGTQTPFFGKILHIFYGSSGKSHSTSPPSASGGEVHFVIKTSIFRMNPFYGPTGSDFDCEEIHLLWQY